jgi:hypothetical protein
VLARRRRRALHGLFACALSLYNGLQPYSALAPENHHAFEYRRV